MFSLTNLAAVVVVVELESVAVVFSALHSFLALAVVGADALSGPARLLSAAAVGGRPGATVP